MVKKIIPFIIIVLSVFFAGLALMHSGLPPTHDGEYHVIRFYEFDKTLRSGSVYPRWAPDLAFGYGMPLLNYVYPLPNYMASFFHTFGFSFIDSFKLNMFFALLVGAIGMYLWSKYIWGNIAGIVSSFVYTFAPYHFVDIYIRGSVGEVWALGFFPLFLWIYTKAIKEKNLNYAFLAGIFLACVIFSHNILALGFFPFACIYGLVLIYMSLDKKNASIFFISSLIIGICLSTIFWVPAIFETKYVTGLQVFDVTKNFPDLFQLLVPSWGSGFFGDGLSNQMSVQIGVVNIFVIVVSLFSLIVLFKKKDKKLPFIVFALLLFVTMFFLMLKISLPFWQHIPLLNYFQFPWRMLSLVILVVAFLAGSIIYIFPKKLLILIFLVLPILSTLSYKTPAYYMERTDAYYTSRSNFIDGTNSPGNEFSTRWLILPSQKVPNMIVLPTNEKVQLQKKLPTKLTFTSHAKEHFTTEFAVTYFPGWMLLVDGKNISTVNSNGLVTVQVPSGNHILTLTLIQTTIQKIASIISLSTLVLVLTIILKNWYSKRYAHRS